MELVDFADKHKDKIGFVIGSGPSLHFQDLSNITDYVTLTVNSGILKVPNCDYFVSDDQDVRNWNYYQETARESKCIKFLFEEKLPMGKKDFREGEVILCKHKKWFSSIKQEYYPEGVRITKDPNLPIIGARTSAGTAVHFAHIMGCDPIVLLGCDCCYSNGKRYFWQFDGETKAVHMKNRKIILKPTMGLRRGKPIDSHCSEFDRYWCMLATKNKDINIIYASEGGVLPYFPTMSLVAVLEKYGDRKK